MPLNVWTSARYTIPLPADHRFPIAKYALLRDRVVGDAIVIPANVHEPLPASWEDVLRVHTEAWAGRLERGELSANELRRLGFPWSEALVQRARRAVGGTCETADCALRDGVAMNLAGGTHHAFANHGEGFCVLNDVAIALHKLFVAGRITRATIVDLDVHQGNGSHAIFANDPRVFTFSMHGRKNYPFHKIPGDLDIELDDGTGDDLYLAKLRETLPTVLTLSAPDLVMYLAGADPHEGDRLGRLKLTFRGLAERDHIVLKACREVGIPVAITIAGGYGRDLSDTVAVHATTARIAGEYL